MITPKKRRGPPKSDVPPLSGKERARIYRNKIKTTGGAEVRVNLDATEIALLDDIREKWNLSADTTNSEVLKAMVVVLSGNTLITRGNRVTADIIVLDATNNMVFSKRWPLCLPGALAVLPVKNMPT